MRKSGKSIKQIIHYSTIRQMHFMERILKSRATQLFLGLLIVVGITTIVLGSFERMATFSSLFKAISFLSAFIFTIEYAIRLYIAPLHFGKHHWLKSRLSYMFSFMGLIDFIAILPFTVPYFFGVGDLVGIVFELGRIILIFKLFRYSKSFQTIQAVIGSIRYELLTSFSLLGIIISFSAILMYYVERNAQPDKFSNIGEGFWWAIISFTTVGYGDVYPVTAFGKFFASSMAIVGMIAFSLPTALFSGAFMNYLQEEKEKKERMKKTRKLE